MRYAVDCFELGFICESAFHGEDRSELLDRVLVHVDEGHGTGARSSGFKDFIGRHINQVQDEPSTETTSAGHRRATHRTARLTAWIADRLGRPDKQHHHDEEHTP